MKSIKYILSIVMILLVSMAAAATYTWTGNTNTDWGTATNWSPGGIPSSSDDVVISNQSNNPLLDQSRSVNSISISSGTVNLNGFTLTSAGSSTSVAGGTFSNGKISFAGGVTTISGTTFSVVVYITSGAVTLASSTFNDTLLIVKTGGTTDNCNGGNTFNGYTSISNTGAGIIRLAYTTGDTYNNKVVFKAGGTEKISPSYSGTNVYNDSVLVSSTGSALGVRFGQNGGTSTLAANKGIAIHTSGFSNSRLELGGFTKNGTNPLALVLTGTAEFRVRNNSTFNGNITVTAPKILLDGATFNNAATLEQNGTDDASYSSGGNTFKGSTTIRNSGTGRIRLANTSGDDFQDAVTFESSNNDRIDVAYNGSTSFGGNITLLSSGSATGIRFGQGSGTSTLAAGKTIAISGSSMTGDLYLKSFTQSGSTAQSIANSGAGTIYFETGTTFNGALTLNAVNSGGNGIIYFNAGFTSNGNLIATANNFYFDGAAFNGSVSAEKTGSAAGVVNNNSYGGNTFAQDVTFTNSSNKLFLLAKYVGDDFNGDFTFIQSGSGEIKPANSGSNYFAGDITANNTYNSDIVEFSEIGGQVILNGSAAQSINGNLTEIEFDTVDISQGSGTVSLNSQIELQRTNSRLFLGARKLDLNSKALIIRSSSASAITCTSGYILSESSNNTGKVTWDISNTTGAHVFPFGNSSGEAISYTFNLTSGNAGSVSLSTYATDASCSPYPSGVSNLNKNGSDNSANIYHRFYQIDLSGQSSPVATMVFNYVNSELPTNGEGNDGLEAQRWNSSGTAWDAAHPNQTQDISNNTVTVAGVSNFSPWLLSKKNADPLPVEWLYFSVEKENHAALLNWSTASEINNDYFAVEYSLNGSEFKTIDALTGAGNSSSIKQYTYTHTAVQNGVNYYRLKQVDYNGHFEYSPVRSVIFENQDELSLYPNPVQYKESITVLGINEEGQCGVSVKNNLGQELYKGTTYFQNGSINVGLNELNLPQGLYFVTILSVKGSLTLSFVVE